MKTTLCSFLIVFAAFVLSARTAPCAITTVIDEVESIVLDATVFGHGVLDQEPQSVERVLRAQQRMAQLGEVGDRAVAAIIVLALYEWKTRQVGIVPSSPPRNHVDRLMKAVRSDSKLASTLLPAYREWLDIVASERLTHTSLSITEEAAIYLLLWGDESDRQKLREHIESLSKSSNPNLSGIAPNLRMILDDKRPYELPPAPKTAFHEWCEISAATITADRAPTLKIQQVLKPTQTAATQSERPSTQKPSPTTKAPEAKPVATSGEPTSSTLWLFVGVLIVAAIGLLWLLLKGRAK